MLLVLETDFFSSCISRIESIGDGWAGGGGGGWRAECRVKHPFGLKEQCCAFRKLRELIQSTREAQTAMRSSFVPSPINAPQDHEMHPRSFTALVKSRL